MVIFVIPEKFQKRSLLKEYSTKSDKSEEFEPISISSSFLPNLDVFINS